MKHLIWLVPVCALWFSCWLIFKLIKDVADNVFPWWGIPSIFTILMVTVIPAVALAVKVESND